MSTVTDRTFPPLTARIPETAIRNVAQWCDDMANAEREPGQSWMAYVARRATLSAMADVLRDLTVVGVSGRRRS
jgi:hypothetical protein